MKTKLSSRADRALLFIYLLESGLPEPEPGEDHKAVQLRIFRELTGLSEYEAVSAFAELEDAQLVAVSRPKWRKLLRMPLLSARKLL